MAPPWMLEYSKVQLENCVVPLFQTIVLVIFVLELVHTMPPAVPVLESLSAIVLLMIVVVPGREITMPPTLLPLAPFDPFFVT